MRIRALITEIIRLISDYFLPNGCLKSGYLWLASTPSWVVSSNLLETDSKNMKQKSVPLDFSGMKRDLHKAFFSPEKSQVYTIPDNKKNYIF